MPDPMDAAPNHVVEEPLPVPKAESYWLSSLDLRYGLDMRVLAVSRLSRDVLRELLRLHGHWHAAAPAERGADQASSRAGSR